MEDKISISDLWSGLGLRLASNGFQCGLLALLAFLPIGGLALISPDQLGTGGTSEFLLAAILLSRFLTPPVAALVVAYLARKEGLLPADQSLWLSFRRCGLPSAGLVLGVAVFTLLSSLLLVVPGVTFALATCVVLPVMVVENMTGPQAVRPSWEVTRDHRWSLFGFWLGLAALASAFLAVIFLLVSEPVGSLVEPLPLVQKDIFLPMVLASAFLYAVGVIASFQIYTRLAVGASASGDSERA